LKSNNFYKIFITSLVLFIILACNAITQIPTNTPSPAHLTAPIVPTATIIATTVPLGDQVTLSTVSLHETNQTPGYEIKAEIPTLQGSTDIRVVNFNTKMTKLVNNEIDAFKKNVSDIPVDPNFAASFLEVKYTPLFHAGDIFSIKFDFSFYSSGAAHPGLYSITVNYDLAQGRELTLSDLFLPNSNYLEVLSNYCIPDLKKQNPEIDDSFLGGAAPTPENYRNWNITTDGLMVTFDEYQVAPYAAGPQKVIMPYSELQAVINRQGPLGKIIP
jgi:Protein of unknown function (DUF3298)